MLKIERPINNPKDIAHIVFRAAESEIDEIIEENKKRAERFKKPLETPAWNVREMLGNLNNLTEKTFTPHFQRYASEHPWDGKLSAKDWAEIATKMLRDYYLLPYSKYDDDLFKQICEIWPELTPDPVLTKEQRAELATLQLQADNIMARGEELVKEFKKLAEQEKNIIRNSQSKFDELIKDQSRYLKVDIGYHEKYVRKW